MTNLEAELQQITARSAESDAMLLLQKHRTRTQFTANSANVQILILVQISAYLATLSCGNAGPQYPLGSCQPGNAKHTLECALNISALATVILIPSNFKHTNRGLA